MTRDSLQAFSKLTHLVDGKPRIIADPPLIVPMSGLLPEQADSHPVTVEDFRRFVKATQYVTVAERPLDPADYPGAHPDLLVPGSLVFHRTPARWTCATTGIGGPMSPAPAGATPRGRTATAAAANGTR